MNINIIKVPLSGHEQIPYYEINENIVIEDLEIVDDPCVNDYDFVNDKLKDAEDFCVKIKGLCFDKSRLYVCVLTKDEVLTLVEKILNNSKSKIRTR